MPAIPAIYDPNHKDINDAIDAERKARIEMIERARQYYDGDHRSPLRGRAEKDNIILNLCGRVIDKTSEFIGIPEQILLSKAENSPAQAELDKRWDEWRMDVPETIQDGLVCGHIFLKLHTENGKTGITLIDPATISACWDIRNPKRLLFYRMEWELGKTVYRQDIVRSDLVKPAAPPPGATPTDDFMMLETPPDAGWWIYDYTQTGGGRWERGEVDFWAFPFAPVVDWPIKKRAHQYYGESWLHKITMLNDSVNFTASNIGRIIKFHGHPKTIVAGGSLGDADAGPKPIEGMGKGEDVDTDAGGVWEFDDPNVKVYNVEMQSDLISSMNFLNLLKAEVFASARVLDLATVQDKMGKITNFGVRMLFSDMIEARDETTRVIGDGFAEAFRRALVADNVTGVDAMTPISAVWGKALPVDRVEQLNAALMEKSLGTTSQKTIAEDIGRNYEAEQKQRDTEATTVRDTLVETLEKVGQNGARVF